MLQIINIIEFETYEFNQEMESNYHRLLTLLE